MTGSAPQTRRAVLPWSPTDLWGVLLAILFSMAVIGLAYTRIWPLSLNIGQHDQRFVAGFHEPEAGDGISTRWSQAHSELAVPQAATGPYILRLRLVNSYPDQQPDPQISLHTSQRSIASFIVSSQASRQRWYSLLMPVEPQPDWASRISIDSTTYTPPGDARALGVRFDTLQLLPTLVASRIPPLWVLFWSSVSGAALYWLIARVSGRRILALCLSMLICALVACGIWQLPLEVAPFLMRLAAIPVIGLLGIGLLAWLIPYENAPGQIRIAGQYLPIVLAIGWWLPTLFQAVLVLDQASIGVGDETLVLGLITLLLLVIALVAVTLRGQGQPNPIRRQLRANASLVALAAGATIHLGYAIWYAFTRSGKDFWILFRGARDWARGGSFYDLEAVLTNHVGAVFKVPPFYGMLFAPFTSLDGLQVLFFHRLLNLGLVAATVFLLWRMLKPQPAWWGLATLLILLNGRPLADTIAFGQIDLMLLFLLTAALSAMRSNRDMLAGILVALGTLFKIYPVILLAFFVVKGRWRSLIGFVVGMLAANGLAVALVGWEMHRIYLFEVLPRIGGTTAWVENQTISGVLARLVDPPFEARILENRMLNTLGTAISALVSAIACWFSLYQAPATSTRFGLQYAQYLLLMVFAVPAAWMHYETLLILPYALLLWHLRDRQVPLPTALLLALSFGLIFYGNQWSFNGTIVMGILTMVGISYKFYGMLLLGLLLLGVLRSESSPLVIPDPFAGRARNNQQPMKI